MPQLSFKRILILIIPFLIALTIVLAFIILVSPFLLIYMIIKEFLDFTNSIHKRNKFLKLEKMKKDA